MAAPILLSFCARCMASCYGNIDTHIIRIYIYIYNVETVVLLLNCHLYCNSTDKEMRSVAFV